MTSQIRRIFVGCIFLTLLLGTILFPAKSNIAFADGPPELVWPVNVNQASWKITGGYYSGDHGCRHLNPIPNPVLNCGTAYQLFGLDLARKDGEDATKTSIVTSPVAGTIAYTWSTSPGDCIIIPVDGVSGYGTGVDGKSTLRISLCHIDSYNTIGEGTTVGVGTPLGTISDDGSNTHLHFSIYDLDPTKADTVQNALYRTPVPFTGPMRLRGCPDLTENGSLNWAAKTYGGQPDQWEGDISCPMKPGGYWTWPTKGDKSIIGVPSTITLSAHIQDNSNGGLSRVNITINNPSDGQGWRVLTPYTYNNAPAEADVSAIYSIPTGTNYILVSFDVYSTNGSRQLAPHGIRKFCASLPCEHTPGVSLTNYPWGGGPSGAISCSAISSSQVALFTETSYSGNCAVKEIGEYRDADSTGLPNDSIKSVKVGGNVKVQLCRDSNLSNTCEWLESDDSDLSNNSVGALQVSSAKVETRPVTTGCVPGLEEISLFEDANYGGLCVTKRAGDFNNPSAIGLSNDSISSVKVGDRMKVLLCRDDNLSNTCEWIDYNDSDLSNNTIGTNLTSSAKADYRGGIELCDGTNYGGPCVTIGEGEWNLSNFSFNDMAESVRFLDHYQNRYHVVLWSNTGQSGTPYHADSSVTDLGSSFRNTASSIQVYKHQVPGAPSNPSPGDGNVSVSTTTNKTLTFNGGDESRVHVWGNGYDYIRDWNSSTSVSLTGLTPGMYYWQAQSRNIMGEGPWSEVWTFAINRAPEVSPIPDYQAPAWTGYSYILSAVDLDGTAPDLSVTGLPSFASFTDNGNGTAALTLLPDDGDTGTYTVTLTADDGEFEATDQFLINVFQQRSTTIYDESLASGWENWSWNSTVNFNDTTKPYTPIKDVKWTPTGAYGGLYLHSNNLIDTSGYYGITFVLQASASGSQLGVQTYDAANGGIGSLVSLSNYGGNPPTLHHRMYTVPFSALGAENTTISGFHIQDITGTTLQPIYVDRIMLVGNSGDPWVELPSNKLLAYNDALASGWQNWSWDSTINWTGGPSYTGNNSISWTPTAGWAGLDIHNPTGINTSSYTTVHFALKATAANEEFAVFLDGGNGNPIGSPIALINYGGDPVTGWWKRYDIPLADLSGSNTTVTGIVIQSNKSTSQATIYVDEVGFY